MARRRRCCSTRAMRPSPTGASTARRCGPFSTAATGAQGGAPPASLRGRALPTATSRRSARRRLPGSATLYRHGDRPVDPDRARKRRAGLTNGSTRFRAAGSAPRVGAPLRARLNAWRGTALGVLRDVDPALPPELRDRAADVWEPLLAIADLVGRRLAVAGSWSGDGPVRAGVGGRRHRLDSPVGGCPSGFHRKRPSGPRSWFTGSWASRTAPGQTGAGGRPITQARVARLLRPFGIYPLKLCVSGREPPTVTPSGCSTTPGRGICPGCKHRRSSFLSGWGVSAGSAPQFGSTCRTAPRTCDTVSPVNSRCPVSISKSTTPNDQMSPRLSTVLPLACSGDIYAAVPMITPICVAAASPITLRG